MGNSQSIPGKNGVSGTGTSDVQYNSNTNQFTIKMSDGSVRVVNMNIYNSPSLTGKVGPSGNTIQSISTSGDGITSLVGKATDTNGAQYNLGALPLYKDYIKNNIIQCDAPSKNCTVPSNVNSLQFGSNSSLNTSSAINNNNTTANLFVSGWQGINAGGNQLNRDKLITNRLLTYAYGPYMVVTNQGSNLCLDANECGQNSGKCGTTCDKTKDSQMWFYNPITGRMINKTRMQCLDHANNNITLKDCNFESYDQYWYRTTDSELRLAEGPCMDLNAPGGNYQCIGSSSDNKFQRLAFIPPDQMS